MNDRQPDPSTAAANLAAAMVQMVEGLAPLREAVKGYRLQLTADGFDDHVAGHMAEDLHRHLLGMAFKGRSS